MILPSSAWPWVDRYRTIPHRDGGRTFSGADCWGLCQLVLAAEEAVWIADTGRFARPETPALRHKVWALQSAPPADTAQIEPRAILLLARAGDGRRVALHAGIGVDDRHILHTTAQRGAQVQTLEEITREWQITAVYPVALVRSLMQVGT
jgi:cell wall-associated NlpC family hydrolase